MNEVWLPVKGYEGLYEVSNIGRVKALAKVRGKNNIKCQEMIKVERDNGIGYKMVTLSANSCKKNQYIHRLVATAFIGELSSGMEVNHIDGNKANNAEPNLEIVSRLQNEKHAWKTGLKNMRGRLSAVSKQVAQLDMFGSVVKVWDSISAAGISLGIDKRHIVACCNGKRESFNNTKWSWEK